MEKTKLHIGQKAYFWKTIRADDVTAFAGLTGDFSRIHVDEEYAKTQRFGKPIAHGLLASSFISTIMGMKLPGPGCLFLDETVEFKLPTFFNDTITTEVELTGVVEKKSCWIAELKGQCINQRGEVITVATCHQMLPKENFIIEE